MPPILKNGKTSFRSLVDIKVVYVTVALDNDVLVQALSKRRALLQQASFKQVEESHSLEQLQEIPESLAHTNKLLYKKLKRMNETCRELLQQTVSCVGSLCHVSNRRVSTSCTESTPCRFHYMLPPMILVKWIPITSFAEI